MSSSKAPEAGQGVSAPRPQKALVGMEAEERFDLLDARGRPLRDGDGRPLTKARRAVHRDGDWHQAVHV